jgi:hypothetical protein
VDDRGVPGEELSREELLALVAAQAGVIEQQAQRIEQLEMHDEQKSQFSSRTNPTTSD